MKKKVLSILLVSIMIIASLLTGCSGSKKTSASAAAKWSMVLDTTITHPSSLEGFLNENYGISIGFGGEIHYTNDQGQTWPESKNSSRCRFCLDIVDENLAWSGGNGKNVRVTKDGGKTWSEVTDLDLKGYHFDMDFIDDKMGWIVTNKRGSVTKDGGITWTELALPEEIKGIAAIRLRTSEDGYLLTNNGLLFTTTDGGTTWSSRDLNFESFGVIDEKGNPGLFSQKVTLAEICFTDDDNGIIVFSGVVPGEGAKVFCLTTNDGGENWTSEKLELREGFAASKVYISGDGLYLTLGSSDGQILLLKREN